jgi:hypothetical protein
MHPNSSDARAWTGVGGSGNIVPARQGINRDDTGQFKQKAGKHKYFESSDLETRSSQENAASNYVGCCLITLARSFFVATLLPLLRKQSSGKNGEIEKITLRLHSIKTH